MLNARDSVSSRYPNTEKRVEDKTRRRLFLTKFEVFGQTINTVSSDLYIFSIETKNKGVYGEAKCRVFLLYS